MSWVVLLVETGEDPTVDATVLPVAVQVLVAEGSLEPGADLVDPGALRPVGRGELHPDLAAAVAARGRAGTTGEREEDEETWRDRLRPPSWAHVVAAALVLACLVPLMVVSRVLAAIYGVMIAAAAARLVHHVVRGPVRRPPPREVDVGGVLRELAAERDLPAGERPSGATDDQLDRLVLMVEQLRRALISPTWEVADPLSRMPADVARSTVGWTRGSPLRERLLEVAAQRPRPRL